MLKPVRFGIDGGIPGICFDHALKAVFTRANPKSRAALKNLPSCLKRQARDISAGNTCHVRREDI